MYTERLSEQLAVVSCIDPDAHGPGTAHGDAIDMENVRRVLFIVQVGDMEAGSTVEFTVNGDTAANGTFANPVTGKAITPLGAGVDDNSQVLVEVTAEEAKADGFTFIRGTLTVADAASDASVVALGGYLRYSPAAAYGLDSVIEIVD